jgi:hypothetical protein
MTKPKRRRFPAAPIDIDPGIVRGKHSAYEPARRAFAALHSGWNTLAEASERITDGDKLAREAKAHRERILRSARADNDRLWAGYRHLREKIHAAVAPGPRDPIAAEIRTWLRSTPDPAAEVRKAIEAGDRQIVSAMLSGPVQLSGITREQHDRLHEHAMRTFEFEDWEAMEALSHLAQKHGNYIDRFERESGQHITAWETGDDAAIKELFGDKT